MSFEIPAGLTDLLQDFTVAVLKERPADLVQFAADYFNKLNENRNAGILEKPKGVRFIEAEPMQTGESDEEPAEGMLLGFCLFFAKWRIQLLKYRRIPNED